MNERIPRRIRMKGRRGVAIALLALASVVLPSVALAQGAGGRSTDPGVAAPTAGVRTRPLLEAVKKSDTASIRALLQQKTDVNAAEPDGTTALHWAAHRDDVTAAELLLRAGATVQSANRYGVTPLSLACTNGNETMIELLLKAGANPNTPLREGETPLMTAAYTGKPAAVKVLLAHGADAHAKEEWGGQNALIWAASEGHSAAAQVLIDHGADVNARSKGNYSPLMFAARQGHLDTVRLLIAAGANVNDTQSQGAGPLLMSVHNGHHAIARLLLEKGADPNLSTAGYAALHVALQVRRPDLDGFKQPVISDKDSLDLIKALLAKGADVNAAMTKNFIGLGAPTDTPLPGATPFFIAARVVDVPVMRLLLASGADPLTPTKGKTTPLMAAAGVGHSQGYSRGTESEALEAVKLTVELGGDVNAANAIGYTAMHGAVIRGANSVVRFLVEKGARIDAKDKRGRTPLFIAENGAGASDQRRQIQTAELLRELLAAQASR